MNVDWHKKALVVFDSSPPGNSEMRRIGLDDLHVQEGRKREFVLNPRELIVFREA